MIETSSLIPIPGCILTVDMEPHPTLARAAHLLPPCTLIFIDDIVPGLLQTKAIEGAYCSYTLNACMGSLVRVRAHLIHIPRQSD